MSSGPVSGVHLKPPLLQWHESHYHAVFDLDFSKSKKRLCSEFLAWLDLAENRERFEKYKRQTTGTTGEPLDRLKDLAMWRLYREFENNWSKANDFADTHRKGQKPFHDARKGQSQIHDNQAPLASEESHYLKATKRAKTYLAQLIPAEFDAPGAPEPAWTKALEKFLEIENAKKISKRSSLKP